MKILKTSIYLLILSLLASCGDDELLSETLIGTWDLVSYQRTDCDDDDELLPLTTVAVSYTHLTLPTTPYV